MPNVWTDISGGPALRGSVKHVMEEMSADRVVFGSDCFCRTPQSQLYKVLAAKLSEEQKHRILYDNARDLFKDRLRIPPLRKEIP